MFPFLWTFRVVGAVAGAIVLALTVENVTGESRLGDALMSGIALFMLGIAARPVETTIRHHAEGNTAGRLAHLYGAISAWLYLWPAIYAILLVASIFTFGTMGVGSMRLTPWWGICALLATGGAYALLEVNLPVELMSTLHEWRIARFRPWRRRHRLAYLPTRVPDIPRTAYERRNKLAS